MDGFVNPNHQIPVEVWAGWVERACAINEFAAPDRPISNPSSGPTGSPSDDSPGTDFNRRGSWSETGLFDQGWAWVRQSGDDRGLITRPGKDGGVSASIGMVTSRQNGWPLFWCWSTSVPEFVAEQPYNRFAVFTALNHRGDFKAAARALADRGYGHRQPEVPIVLPSHSRNVTGSGLILTPTGEPAEPDRLFRWMSELRFRPQNDKWLWDGYLSRGGVTMLSALWKAGKSTLLSHLIRAFDGRSELFLGRPITPGRVLYVSEEHEEMWAERRDDLGIGDHVGMVCRPFKGRPSPAEWAAFLGSVVKSVDEYRFDLVVFDTISKLWPVREENDAGQVEDALMPVWNITNGGAALLMVHHNRKSGGKEFTGSRGSGGLPAFCETLIEFSRNTEDPKDCHRVLVGGGRYRETPAKLLIELTPSGYVSHGDPDDGPPIVLPPARDWKALLTSIVGTESKRFDEIQSALAESGRDGQGVRKKDLIDELNRRVEGGEYERMGLGTKGSPFRWSKVSFDSSPGVPPLGKSEEQDLEPNE
ncbi:AAA family ATPase [Fimbriiglobus ruber]|uniref:Uncharacterized protein n=1 Tax=Fimbriiglobus ruber TaxID=1908690 RepID=A0A225CYA5_9BACT|nr:AAA family ATPase [Fimbriiglobus ruber]OWK34360.1 hypothetical protein FRUB_10331 [Fimbriiglobus ruber]